MAIRTNHSIDLKIIDMRKNERAGLFTIFKWVKKWEDFTNLDEIIVLVHILNVLNWANLAVSKNEVRNNFNRFYNKDYHGEKKSYLAWIYKQTSIKEGTIVKGSQIRNKRPIRQTTEQNKVPSPSFHGKFRNCKEIPLKALGGLINE